MTVLVLTEQAELDRSDFDALDDCCSCHINPPCNWCIHPGNPANQEEDNECWEPATVDPLLMTSAVRSQR